MTLVRGGRALVHRLTSRQGGKQGLFWYRGLLFWRADTDRYKLKGGDFWEAVEWGAFVSFSLLFLSLRKEHQTHNVLQCFTDSNIFQHIGPQEIFKSQQQFVPTNYKKKSTKLTSPFTIVYPIGLAERHKAVLNYWSRIAIK